MIEWPDIPYQPVVGSFRHKPRDGLQRSTFEQGPKRSRVRFTGAVAELSFTLIHSRYQAEAFKQFYHRDLHQGSDHFIMRLWNGAYIGYDVHFLEPYDLSDFASLECEVSVRVEARGYYEPVPYYVIFWINAFTDEGLVALANLFHPIVNVQLPAASGASPP